MESTTSPLQRTLAVGRLWIRQLCGHPDALIIAVAWTAILTAVALPISPWLTQVTTLGFHDWDVQTSHRYLASASMLRYGEFPGWNPYACGGFPAWGYIEADTIVVSPFLPVYLLAPIGVALRIEVLAMALVGAVGAYAVASRFTASYAARSLVPVLWAANGRWALQTAAGHTWHLAYAWMPWCLFFFERARAPERRVRDLAAAGGCLAMLVYSGGIYPLPHTCLFLGLYAALLSLSTRTTRPLATLAGVGMLGAALSTPKLLPMLDSFGKAPRLVESTEKLGLGAVVTLLTSRDQGFYSRPARVEPWGWHEWGMYISIAGLLVLFLGVVYARGTREASLTGVGLVFFLLGLGSFHPWAPWPLLHQHAPFFRSLHVPSRFLYPAVLALGLAAASGVGFLVAAQRITRPWIDRALTLAVLALALDIGSVARKPMVAAMSMVPPSDIRAHQPFHHEQAPPIQYAKPDIAPPMYLAMLANTGVMNCYGTPPFDRVGAQPIGAAGYRGEAYVVSLSSTGGPGPTAKVVRWSPNRAVIDVSEAAAGAILVYNMNYDEGWSADAGPVIAYRNTVATRLSPGVSRVTFSYHPPHLFAGLFIATLAALALLGLGLRGRREPTGIAARGAPRSAS